MLIVGCITGSLMAEQLTHQGLDVVVIDREPGHGSTAASTKCCCGNDRSLTELTAAYGFERAGRAYRASLEAVHGLKSLVARLALPCEMRDKDLLYLAAGDTAAELMQEHELAPARVCREPSITNCCSRVRDRAGRRVVRPGRPMPIRQSAAACCRPAVSRRA